MTEFQVKLFTHGKWDGDDYQKVAANTAKEAAEKLCGNTLNDRGSNYDMRAMVRRSGDIKSNAIIFYER
jgi:hypothetical protein